MKYGSVRRSIALPDLLDANYSPDGLSEAGIDALLAEAGIEDVQETDTSEVAPVFPLRSGERDSKAIPTGGEAA